MASDESRRAFLAWSKRLVAGGTVAVLGGAAAWRITERDVFADGKFLTTDLAELTLPAGSELPLKSLCAAAMRAPSVQNSQPWLFNIESSRIILLADMSRHIPALDPTARQLFLSAGCALENIDVAARASGLRANIKIIVNSESPAVFRSRSVPVAEITISRTSPASPSSKKMLGVLEQRRTGRYGHDLGQSIPKLFTDRLIFLSDTALTKLHLSPHTAREHSAFVRSMTEALSYNHSHDDRRTAQMKWFRCTEAEAREKGDGVGLDALGISPIYLPLWKFWRCPSVETLISFRRKIAEERIPFSNFLGALLVPVGDRSLQTAVEAGRVWQRMNLQATMDKLAVHPINALVTNAEFAADKKAALMMARFNKTIVRNKDWTPIVVFRLGLPTATGGATPRRSVDSVIVS